MLNEIYREACNSMAKRIDVVKREGDGKFVAWVQIPISRLDKWTKAQFKFAKNKFWFQDHLKWVIIAVASSRKEALAKAQSIMDTKLTVG